MSDKRLNLLGIAQVAGRLVSGSETVLRAIQSEQATLVIVASDASAPTKKRLQAKCQSYEIPYLEAFDSQALSQALGKKRTVCALTDAGFTQSFMKQTRKQANRSETMSN